jgi:hypothetical protein
MPTVLQVPLPTAMRTRSLLFIVLSFFPTCAHQAPVRRRHPHGCAADVLHTHPHVHPRAEPVCPCLTRARTHAHERGTPALHRPASLSPVLFCYDAAAHPACRTTRARRAAEAQGHTFLAVPSAKALLAGRSQLSMYPTCCRGACLRGQATGAHPRGAAPNRHFATDAHHPDA